MEYHVFNFKRSEKSRATISSTDDREGDLINHFVTTRDAIMAIIVSKDLQYLKNSNMFVLMSCETGHRLLRYIGYEALRLTVLDKLLDNLLDDFQDADITHFPNLATLVEAVKKKYNDENNGNIRSSVPSNALSDQNLRQIAEKIEDEQFQVRALLDIPYEEYDIFKKGFPTSRKTVSFLMLKAWRDYNPNDNATKIMLLLDALKESNSPATMIFEQILGSEIEYDSIPCDVFYDFCDFNSDCDVNHLSDADVGLQRRAGLWDFANLFFAMHEQQNV